MDERMDERWMDDGWLALTWRSSFVISVKFFLQGATCQQLRPQGTAWLSRHTVTKVHVDSGLQAAWGATNRIQGKRVYCQVAMLAKELLNDDLNYIASKPKNSYSVHSIHS